MLKAYRDSDLRSLSGQSACQHGTGRLATFILANSAGLALNYFAVCGGGQKTAARSVVKLTV